MISYNSHQHIGHELNYSAHDLKGCVQYHRVNKKTDFVQLDPINLKFI